MKKVFFTIIVCNFLSCVSIKQYNEKLARPISPANLKADVAFTQEKLQKLQPNLYWYISKEKLDAKFDSLKSSISEPMTSIEFHKKLVTVTNAIGQGHLYLYQKTKKYDKTFLKSITKKGKGPLSQFEFEVFDNKLYVAKNKSTNLSIKVGTEVLSVNGHNSSALLSDFSRFFTSDGYNKTFFKYGLSQRFSSYYSSRHGILDSLTYGFKMQDSSKTIVIKRLLLDSSQIKKAKVVLTTAQKKAKRKKNKLLGFDADTKTYMRNLSFVKQDSSVAIIKIKGFKDGNFKKCYQLFFESIKNNKSKTLVLDLRNNGGGRLDEISNLYTYLADSTFIFLKPSELASKTSLMQMDYFKGTSLWLKPFQIVGAPFFYSFLYLKTYKNNGKFYFNTKTKRQKIAENNFKGKIYVLINGGSFSASSIISSNLKGSKRATFVGEETGGSYNGTVAGQMPNIKLPHSELLLKVGLMAFTPYYQTDVEGRGIFPDVEILPTVTDRISNVDREMEWILKDVETRK